MGTYDEEQNPKHQLPIETPSVQAEKYGDRDKKKI